MSEIHKMVAEAMCDMAKRDSNTEIVEMLDDVTDIIDKILEKFKNVLHPDDLADLDNMANTIAEIADCYVEEGEEEAEEVKIPEVV